MFTDNYYKLGFAAVAVLALSACASVDNPNPADPFESYNRGVTSFNEVVDDNVFKPVVKGYNYVVPQPARTCVRNIFGNLDDGWSAINDGLQFRGRDMFHNLGRFVYNSTIGLGGCIDVASMSGVEKRSTDFGTTLGVWGVPSGPYFVLPFMGPSTIRDTTGLAVDGTGKGFAYLSPFSISEDAVAWPLAGLQAIDTRDKYMEADDLANDIALDKYSFVRDGYLQNRDQAVRHAKAPVVVDKSKKAANGFVPYYYDDAGSSSGSGSLPTYDDPDAPAGGSDLPQYEDPEAAGGSQPAAPAASGVPQYQDPEAGASQPAAQAPFKSNAPSAAGVPQYVDPEPQASR